MQMRTPLDYSVLSDEQFDSEIEKGFASLSVGKIVLSEQVRENMQKLYEK